MASQAEILPTTKVTPNDGGTTWFQPVDSVIDVSSFSEAAFVTMIQGMTGSGTAAVTVLTAIENRDEHFLECGSGATIVTINGTPGSYPQKFFNYFAGSGTASATPGFARYLRIKVDFAQATDTMTLGVKAVLKP